MIKINYAVLDVPYNYNFSNDVLVHHVYEMRQGEDSC